MQSVMDGLFGGSTSFDPGYTWHDREIRFDISVKDLDCRTSEEIIEIIDPVEDTKGNNGDQGELHATNLRLIWVSKKTKRTNISIGYNCVTAVNVKEADSRIKGKTQAVYVMTKYSNQAVYVMTKYSNQRFEFIFTALAKTNSGMFQTLLGTFKAYDNSRLYRDLKLRGAFIQDRELKLLPLEQTYSRVNGVMNLSSEQGNLGTFFISNVRVVWFANLAEGFNVSLPYLQMKAVRLRESKFGLALVLETTPQSGGYVLGFRVDPKETLDYVYKEISSLWQVYSKAPIFGVEYVASPNQENFSSFKISESEEDVEVADAEDRGDLLATYYADATKGADRDPIYNVDLGLAVEQLKEGVTIDQLWSVL
ncbi:hypothetical protein CEUSTIGMA_g11480.t1 [Chlamydomonas eustigma]|uniref:BBSome complex member BBS5 n=1 Tax=Chlamydomonas eustigma TaxID=1157962 RepID=A0A250XLZ6_9CHLO|nr:hypothetical protein CEUSTIGMA_g11480.t1 [Chlamydomonas eustigma]|eukprot:GAX84056.1 hypothetical protein CEUSTIGMA_g11480.t1 [Chlamydomonas eustigma]